MAVTKLYYSPFIPTFNSNGAPVPGAQLLFYLTGTTTKTPIYTDATLGTQLANPVVADAAGRYPMIYLDPAITYRVRQLDALGVQIGTDSDPYAAPVTGTATSFSVKDYGTVGDGVTSDVTAEAAARAALNTAGGGVLLYPATTGYLLTGMTREPGILILGAGFPSYGANPEPPGPFRVLTTNVNGSSGKIGVSSFIANGNAAPFSTLGGGDSVAISGAVFTGATGTQPAVASNFQCRFTAATPVQWGCEIDMNNQVANGALNNPAYGWGLVVNTGSTYIADTGIVIQRATGEGTGPGYRRGLFISGAREQGVTVQCMDATSFPGMTPAAPGTISAFVISKSSEPQVRYVQTETGAMNWGSGAVATDTILQRIAAGGLQVNAPSTGTQFTAYSAVSAGTIALNVQGNNTTDYISSAVVVPAGTAKNSFNGYAAYVRNDASGAGTTGNGVSFYGVSVANANNGSVWGANYLVVDSPTPNTVSAGTGRKLIGTEIDLSTSSPSSVIQGMSLLGSCVSNPASAVGFSVGELSTQAPGIAKWTFGFNVADGVLSASGAAFLTGAAAYSGTNIASQQNRWGCFDGAGAAQNYSQYIATNQTFVFSSSLSTANAAWQFGGRVLSSGLSVTAGTATFASGVNLGFYGAATVAKQTAAAAATDLASVITLANSLRTALINYGLAA